MSDLAFHKILSEICLFFSIISTMYYWQKEYVLLFALALSCGLAAYFSSKLQLYVVRGLIGLLPACLLYFCQWPVQRYVLAFVCLYTFFICITGKFYLNYWTYKPLFGVCAVAYLIFLFVALSSDLHSNNVALYGLFFLVNGVIALRRTRMGNGLDIKGKAYNALEVVAVVAIGAGAMLVVYFLLTHSLKIVEMVLMPFALLFYGIGKLAVKLGSLFKYKQPDVDQVIEEISDLEEKPLEQIGQQIEETAKNIVRSLPENFWKMVVMVVFVALVILLIYKITQSFSDKPEEKIVFGKMDSFIEKRKKRKLNIVSSNAQRIRAIYRDYLQFIKKKGVIIKNCHTSQDVLLKSETIGDERMAEKLRELYILARYSDGSLISNEDVAMAKKYLEELIATTN